MSAAVPVQSPAQATAPVDERWASEVAGPYPHVESRPSGLWHKLKAYFQHGPHQPDTIFPEAQGRYQQINTTINDISEGIQSYGLNVKSVFLSDHRVSNAFQSIFANSSVDLDAIVTRLVAENRLSAAQVGAAHGEGSSSAQIKEALEFNKMFQAAHNQALLKIEEHLAQNDALLNAAKSGGAHTRALMPYIKRRQDAFYESEYYTNKVARLTAEAAGRNPGVPERTGDRDRLARNQRKLQDAKSELESLENALYVDFYRLNDSRFQKLLPLWKQFVEFQQSWVKEYAESLKAQSGAAAAGTAAKEEEKQWQGSVAQVHPSVMDSQQLQPSALASKDGRTIEPLSSMGAAEPKALLRTSQVATTTLPIDGTKGTDTAAAAVTNEKLTGQHAFQGEANTRTQIAV